MAPTWAGPGLFILLVVFKFFENSFRKRDFYQKLLPESHELRKKMELGMINCKEIEKEV